VKPMNRILSQADREGLAQLVADVERTTAGELVTVVLKRSASYAAYRVGWAAGMALLLTGLVHLLWPALPPMELIGAEALLLVALYAGFGYRPLLRWLVPRAVRQRATNDCAKRLFLELGVTETRDRSGVLILLSELERRVEILGDRGIHEHLGAEVWKKLVANLVTSIRDGHAADGLRAVIESLGRELGARFPPRPDDANELPNHVIIED
jgi:putative membrane protein